MFRLAMVGVGGVLVAIDGHAESWSPVVITEVHTEDPDVVEIQNVTAAAIETTGWMVVANVGNSGNVNRMHSFWNLPDLMHPNEVLYRGDDPSDPDHFWGEEILWRTLGAGWVMLVDDAGEVSDFVVWGYPPGHVDNLDVTINGQRITAAEIWNGGPVWAALDGPISSLQRSGNRDWNDASDWAWSQAISIGRQNESLSTPFIPEPSTSLLCVIAVVGLLTFRWRRKEAAR